MKPTPLIFAFSVLAAASLSEAKNNFTPGVAWADTSGQHINAHGCCVVEHEGTFYWFGEDRTGYNSNGISCYTSTDLYNWKRVGLVFNASQAKDETTGKCILERPKVIYNDSTGKWVMYIHWENGDGYGEARVCVATCDRIDGNYTFSSTFRPNNHDSRDQTVFKDTDGKAYHFGSTDMNTNMNVALLAADYLTTEQNPVTETKILKGLSYEAPAIIKAGDTYFGIFSGCTGWDPNPGHTATAYEIMGYWTPGKNFAIDNGAATTYKSQSTYILRLPGYENAYIYMGDRWNSSDVGGKSEYVWLPLSLRSGAPTVKWFDSWDLSVFEQCDRFKRIAAPADGATVRLLDKYSDRWMSSTGNGFHIADDNDAINIDFTLHATENPYIWKFSTESGSYLESVFGAMMLSAEKDSDTQLWRLELEEDGCYIIQNVNDGKVLSVSGGAQLAGTPLFMSNKGVSPSQSFGLYFDTEAHDYEAADQFSADYRSTNLAAIQEQARYEAELGGAAGIGNIAVHAAVEIASANRNSVIFTAARACTIHVDLIDTCSGRTIAAVDAALEAGTNTADLGSELAPGIYVAHISTPEGVTTTKLAVR